MCFLLVDVYIYMMGIVQIVFEMKGFLLELSNESKKSAGARLHYKEHVFTRNKNKVSHSNFT